MKLSDGEKLILVMLAEICERLGIKEEINPRFVKEAIFGGNAWGIKLQYPGIFESREHKREVVDEVFNLLEMWTALEWSYGELSEEDKGHVEVEAAPYGKHVRFPGFDGNNETAQLSVARFVIDHLNRFGNFKGRELNSHWPTLDGYRRMYTEFEPMRSSLAGLPLNATGLIKVLKAQRA